MGLSIALPVPMYVEAVNITFFACLFFLNGQAKTAVKLLLFFGVLAALSYVPQDAGFLGGIVLPAAFMVRRFMLPIVAGKYLIDSTPIGLLMSALEKLKVPQSLVITLSVMFRFFPTLGEEYRWIKNAMKMRGIRFGGGKAGKMLEYRIVPMITCTAKIGEELSASALTRGLGKQKKRTNICHIGFGWADWTFFLLVIAVAVYWILGVFA